MKARHAVVIAVLAAACSSVHPVAVNVGDRCFRCRRSIGDTHLAAELIDTMKVPAPFRTSGCLAKYLKAHPKELAGTAFVADNKSGRLIPAGDAWFVPTTVTSPDGKLQEDDYFAFGSRADARAAAGTATIVRWERVLAAATE